VGKVVEQAEDGLIEDQTGMTRLNTGRWVVDLRKAVEVGEEGIAVEQGDSLVF
jgi:hypothetical protein